MFHCLNSFEFRPFQPIDTEQVNDVQRSATQNDMDPRYVNAQRKRNSVVRKTIAVERSFVDDEENVMDIERNYLKNTNQNIYYSNPLYRTLCMLCLKNEHYLVAHYVKRHPKHEVYIARPSPAMAAAIRAQNQVFEFHKQKVAGLCFFCETSKNIMKMGWAQHIMTHTGEPLYACTQCDFHSKTKTKHPNCNSPMFETIYEKNQSKDTCIGFMCKECNYLQINKANIVAHLTNEHEYRATEVDEHFEKITLVPDLSPVKPNIRYGFIDADTLYKCTICHDQFADADTFKAHFDDLCNGRVNKYTCICGEVLRVHPLNCVSAHLMKHGTELYECMLCKDEADSIYYTEAGILNHISIGHGDAKRTFHHLHREDALRSTVTEITIEKFICTACNRGFDKATEALEHFVSHSGQMVDFKVFATMKSSELDGKNKVIRTYCVANQNKYILRQCFLCIKCKMDFSSKGLLLAHHNRHHTATSLEAKLHTPILIALNEDNASKYQNANEKFDRFMAYSCYWCHDSNNGTDPFKMDFIFDDAKAVHDHWSAEHNWLNDEIDSTEKPFRFYVETLVKCNYCDVISTYKGLQEHTQHYHPKSSICFVNINASSECPLCDFNGNSKALSAHFSDAHEAILTVNMINPNRFNRVTISRLLDIDVHKKSMCELCGESFNVEIEYRQHHELKHHGKPAQLREFVDNSCGGLLASCCETLITPQNFFNHLKIHNFHYSCKQCDVKLSNMEEAAHHDHARHDSENSFEYRFSSLRRSLWKMFQRTKLLFGNGAVLYKHNVLGSTFDDMESFEHYIELTEKKYRAKFNSLLQAKTATVSHTEG